MILSGMNPFYVLFSSNIYRVFTLYVASLILYSSSSFSLTVSSQTVIDWGAVGVNVLVAPNSGRCDLSGLKTAES